MALVDSETELDHGDVAPDFELPGVDGETHSVASFSDNEALLVVFTCNHCPYAKAKFETLNDLAAEYDEVAVVGINPNSTEIKPEDSFERMVELVEDGTIAYDAYLRDESQEVAAAYGAECTPDPFLFAREDREFRLVYHGRLDDAMNPEDEPTEHTIHEAIESALAGEAVDVEEVPSRGCSIKWDEE
ncbi:thioredoxin family protein [Natronorarus salvus]|uniref:thioredoxin family protein n=1 Tax=Natronorarus salvus TaxID=3117733 RepID=UPI002F26D920